MKILFIIDTFYPKLRGGELVILRLSRELVKRGHRVSVVTGRLAGTTAHETLDGIDIHRPVDLNVHGKSRSVKMILGKLKFIWKLYGKLKSFIQEHQPDVIFNQAFTVTIPASLAAHELKVPLITGVGSFQQDLHFKTSPFWVAVLQKYKEQIILRCSRQWAIRVGGDWLNRIITPMTRSKVFTLPSPVDDFTIRNIPTETNRETQRQKLGIADHERFILHVGVKEKVKNLPPLIRAMADFKPPHKLVLAGSGSQEAPLKEMVRRLNLQDRIIFLPSQPNTHVLELMQAADTVVLSSLSEVAPTVVIEALSCGTPVVTTNVGNVKELKSENVYIVETAEEIPKVLEKPIPRKAEPEFLEYYSMHNTAANFEAVFEQATRWATPK